MDKKHWKKLLEKRWVFRDNFRTDTGFSGNLWYNKEETKVSWKEGEEMVCLQGNAFVCRGDRASLIFVEPLAL